MPYVTLEDGSQVLIEDGSGAVAAEGIAPQPGGGGVILLEDGSGALLEDGGSVLTEGGTTPTPTPTPVVRQTFRKALRAKLLSLPDVTAIVGVHAYPGALPQSHDLERDGPAVTYAVAKMPRSLARGLGAGHVLSGSDGTIMARVTIEGYSFGFSDVDALSLVLYDELDGIRNAVDWGDGTTAILSCIYAGEMDAPEPVNTGRGAVVYRIASQFDVHYRVNLPVNSG